MKLIRLHVENFGKLQNFDFSFERGLNVLLEENGWGKSTLAAFIKAMLYGMPASSKQSLDENERKKYMPWQGGAYGGSLEFSTASGKYRIERFFGTKESGDSFVLYDLATNCESTRYSSRVGEELFGIDADGFSRTVYLSQHAVTAKGDNNSITAKLGDLLDDVDDIGSFDDAMAALEKRRKYYKMTGERGRIAEIEREIANLGAQIEQLTRTEDMMRQKESELAALAWRMKELTTSIDEVRATLRHAGLLRERAAFLAQKERMQKELSALEESARELDARMKGKHPTPEEMTALRRLLDNIYEARARVNEIASLSSQPEKYEILKPDFAGVLPTKEEFSAMLSANFELQNIAHREQGLQTPTESTASRHFARQTPPTEGEIKGILDALAAEEAARAAQKEKKGSGRTTAVVCLVLAVLAAVAGFFAPILFALAAVFGMISLCLFLQKKKPEEVSTAFAAEIAARDMLSRYGVSAEGNLRDRLTELSLLSRQWRECEAAEQKRIKSLQALRSKKQQLLRELQEQFRAWDILLPPKNDYRDDIEALRRDVARIARAVAEKEQRDRRREAALAEQKRLQAEFTPFLRHFDPEAKLKPAECLDRVQEWETEYRRLSRRIPELRAELARFVAEKGIDAQTEQQNTSLPDVDALSARERALQKELGEVQNRQVELKSHIGRLSSDVERLPEIEATVRALEEELTQARANSNTIANTAQFLEEAKTGLSTRYLADMQTSFSALLNTLMDDSAPESVMDTSFKVKLRQSGKTQHPESLSQGWRDAVEFCVRLSLTEALYAEGETPPIILDDPFVNLDERRLTAAKRLLVALSEKYQILYLICHAERR
jgi:uncharacterized protein YhaN